MAGQKGARPPPLTPRESQSFLSNSSFLGHQSYLGVLGIFTLWFIKKGRKDPLIVALFSAWVSILVTNFFGFSVVIIGLFFFLIPGFSEIMSRADSSTPQSSAQGVSAAQWVAMGVILIIGFFIEINLANMWFADKSFAYGKNLDGVNQAVAAYPYLSDAVSANPDEPTFRDELSYNEALVALAAFNQIKEGSGSAAMTTVIPQFGVSTNDLIGKAVSDSNKVVEISPKALPFWKTRTKTFYTLVSIDSKYLAPALAAIEQAALLAPTDAKVHYNLGLILGQAGQVSDAIRVFTETVAMKPDYRDAHYALGLYYNQVGRKEDARAQMEFILTKIAPDSDVSKWLEENK
jgi:tetratricopeptide (TPR) repeat protein